MAYCCELMLDDYGELVPCFFNFPNVSFNPFHFGPMIFISLPGVLWSSSRFVDFIPGKGGSLETCRISEFSVHVTGMKMGIDASCCPEGAIPSKFVIFLVLSQIFYVVKPA